MSDEMEDEDTKKLTRADLNLPAKEGEADRGAESKRGVLPEEIAALLEKKPAKKKRKVSHVVTFAFLLLLFYVMGVGPGFYLADKTGSQGVERAVKVVWAPVLWVRGSETLGKPLDFYIYFWRWLAEPGAFEHSNETT